MKTLLELCLKWRLLVLTFVVLVMALGVRSALALPIDAVPDVTNVQVQVLTSAPALGPVDVERNITFPVEASMSGLPGVTEIRSISRAGISVVTVVFEEGFDLVRARQLVGERLVDARERIPPGIEAPAMGPMSTGLGEILQFELRSDRHSAMELRTTLDWFLSYELRAVPGVVEMNAFGGELQTFEVEVEPEALRARDLSLSDLVEAIEANNLAVGGGSILRSGENMLVRGEARLTSLEDVSELVIHTTETGTPIRVRDVGRVHLAPLLRTGAVTRDGRGEVVTGIVMMLVGANGREVVEDVKTRLEELGPSLPEGMTIEVFYDRAELVNRTIGTVATNLAEGALFVALVLFVLLGSIRGGLIVAAAIPFSLLFAFIGMHAAGLSGNLMSLGAVDFGIVVDGSIIVVENAVVYLAAAAHGRKTPLSYVEASQIVVGSTLDVRRAATFGEAIIVIVYVPILTLAGIEGRMFIPMALTVLFALGGAFIASLTFVPVLVATFLRNHAHETETLPVRLAHRAYKPMLAFAMKAPMLLVSISIGLLGVAVFIAQGMGAEFIPRLDEGAIAVQVMRLPSVSLEESVAGATRFELLAREFPEVTTAACRTGRAEIATDPMGFEISDCFLMLRPREAWTTASTREGLVEAMEARFTAELPGLGFSFSQPIELRVSELISGTRSDVAMTIYGDDLAELERASAMVQARVSQIEGASDVRGEQLTGVPSLEVRFDRAQASRFGVTAEEAMLAVSAIGGRQVGEVFQGERRFVLQVRLPEALRNDIERIRRIPVRGEGGLLVPLGQVASIEEVDSPASINREAIRRRTSVEANVRGRDLASFVREAQAAVAELDLPDGYVVRWGGQFENLEAATGRLALAVPLALALIFILLFMAFGELKPALLIFLNVPFAAVGGIFALEARGLPLSISAAIGFIALFGIAVLNGVVLVTTIKNERAKGKPPHEASVHAAKARLRAVLMTATVAALGFMPMAFSHGDGAEVQRPLATVVMGGLVTATALTLLVLPSLYAFIYRREAGAPPHDSHPDLQPLPEAPHD